MSEKILMKGNEAIAESAIRSGCRCYFGYPITPQNEIPEYMSAMLPKKGGVFLQAESEVAAINMVFGAAGAGARVMTSSSSPGISLKQEGISYIAGAELPCVIVNVVRGGPGLGGIQSAQSDYFQATRGGGHGDYHTIVFTPSSVQEAVDITYKAFDVADKYRVPVMILADGMIGQMMEPVVLPPERDLKTLPKKPWATDGTKSGKDVRLINSLYINPDELEEVVHRLFRNYAEIKKNETAVETYMTEDAEIILTAYGTVSRICKSSIEKLREKGIKVGLVRPITVFPFPDETYLKLAKEKRVKKFISVELSMGQMIQDVKLSVNGLKPVEFFGRTGGNVMSDDDIVDFVLQGGKK